jgi:hypothetical protein
MTSELIATFGSILVGAVLVAPLAAFLASMLFEMRPSNRWRSHAR